MSSVKRAVEPSGVQSENNLSKPRSSLEGHFRADIEGMRGIAVLLVVLFHFGFAPVRGGFIGVDVFFVLSGYLITGLIFNEIERTGELYFAGFYARRVRRLLPAAALVLACTLIAGTIVYSPLELVIYVETAVATALYASNLLFLHWTANYFAPQTAGNPFLHAWSLAVEEQFYLVWPALLALLCRKSASKRHVAVWLGVVTALSFAACALLTYRNEPWAFFASPLRAWEFAIGGLAVLIDPEWLRLRRKFLLPLSVAGLFAVLGAALLIHGQQGFPGFVAAIPVIGTTLILIAGAAGQNSGLSRILSVWPLLWLGRLSYSWYLWHWPVLVIGIARFPNLGTGGHVFLAMLSLALSFVTYKLIENPIRYNRKLVSMPRVSLSLAAVVPVLVIGLSLIIAVKARRDSRAPEQQALLKAAQNHSPIAERCITGPGSDNLIECSYGDVAADKTVVLFGDSHADHWFIALDNLALRHHWHLITLLKSACPAARVVVYSNNLQRIEPECASWREEAIRRIQKLKPAAVIISSSAGYLKTPDTFPDSGSTLTTEDWRNGMQSTLASIAEVPSVPIILSDVPRPGFDVPQCLSRARQHGWPDSSCSVPKNKAVASGVRIAESLAAGSVPVARVVDLTDKFCNDTVCSTILSGTVLYRDNNHITTNAAKLFEPDLDQKLAAIIPNGCDTHRIAQGQADHNASK